MLGASERPEGFLRIALSSDAKTWALSVPGTSAELRLTPGSEVSSELSYFSGNSVAGYNPTFNVDRGAAGRSSTRLDGDTVKGLRSATKLNVTMYPKENCDRYSCKFREYVWQSPDFGKAMAALPACLKSN